RAAPLRELARQAHAPDLRHPQVDRLTGDRLRDLDAAEADGQHAQRAGRRRVAVGADHRLTGYAETLHVRRMRDAVARLGVPDAEPSAGRAQEVVVVRVLVVGLQQVVVDVLDGALGPSAVELQRLQLQHHHGAGGVLGQRLVDPQRDLLPRRHLAVHEVGLDQLLRDVAWHGYL